MPGKTVSAHLATLVPLVLSTSVVLFNFFLSPIHKSDLMCIHHVWNDFSMEQTGQSKAWEYNRLWPFLLHGIKKHSLMVPGRANDACDISNMHIIIMQLTNFY